MAERLLASVDDPSIDIGLDPNTLDGRCEFLDGTPLHPRLALALMGPGIFRRHVLAAKSRNLDVSHNARSFPQWMRDAAMVSTRGNCVEDGCDARFHWLHADHKHPKNRGGPTKLSNLDPLCSAANRAKSDRVQPDKPKKPDEPAA